MSWSETITRAFCGLGGHPLAGRAQRTESRAPCPGCVFCDIAAGRPVDGKVTPLLYSDGQAFAFRDRAPAASAHILVCSRDHITSAYAMDRADAPLASHLLVVGQGLVAQAAPGARPLASCSQRGAHLKGSASFLFQCVCLYFNASWFRL